VLTDENGNFTVELLPDLSSGTVVAIKNSTINSTSYSISGGDVFNLIITLNILAAPPAGVEVCTNGWDDDGDQFYWNSTREGLGDAADRCDSDCATTFGISLSRTVTKTYYIPSDKGEYYTDAFGTHDFCSDRFDNDCNGLMDCADPKCAGISPACMETFCGDSRIQFPNGRGVYEQCDKNYTTGTGNDSLCPGKCIEAGKPRQCTCQYDAVCGNAVIDEPLEDCDGVFIAYQDKWDTSKYNTASGCTIDQCGKPTSIRPCQCPPPQICGNGVREEPEQCDGANCDGGEPCSPDCTCPPSPIVCANNLLERGEDCDGTLNLASNRWDVFKTRKYGCSPSGCAVPEGAERYIGPDGAEYSVYADYLSAIGVDSACKCKTQCKQAPPGPTLSALSQTRFKREILLNWSDECREENARAYNVFRCTATGPDGEGCTDATSLFTIINDAPLGLTTQFVDTNFQGSEPEAPKYYCYFVQGVYGDMVTDNNAVPLNFGDPEKGALMLGKFDQTIHCIRAGMEQCFTFKSYFPWATEFCSGPNMNVRSTCDDTNTIIDVADPGNKVNCNEMDEDVGGWTEYVCVGPYSDSHPELPGKTQCVPKSVCDYCNDPFGIFGYSASRGARWDDEDASQLGGDFGKAPLRPPTDSEKRRRFGYVPCVDLDICYMDYAYSNTNKFYSYDVNSSCYDFHSLRACREYNDTIGGGLCEWAWHPEYGELGVGVCRTNVTDKQECERCHDPENEVFGRCDMDACSMYGRCYYDRANLPGEFELYSSLSQMTAENPVKRSQKESDTAFYKCTHERDISCESYDTMDDCIGSSSPYSLSGAENLTANVDVDVSGSILGRIFLKDSGTNTILTESDDFFSFGKCQWVKPHFENYSEYDEEGVLIYNETDDSYFPICIKNSDDSPMVVTVANRSFSRTVTVEQKSDCGGLPTDRRAPAPEVNDVKDCRQDFTDPITTIPHYEDPASPMRIRGTFEFPAVVFDNSVDYSWGYPDTYACVASQGLDCYPMGAAYKLGRDLGNLIAYDTVNVNTTYNFSERGFVSGLHVFKYFSEDISHNLEAVRSFPVFIDADAPNIVLYFTNVSNEVSEDVWRTNLTLNVRVEPRPSVTDDDRFAFCNAKLFLGNASIYPLQDIINEYNNTWTRNYTQMPDDYYTFWYRCEDDVGNVAEGNITFAIDGDKSITNPQPKGTFNHGDLVISVESGTSSECRYLYSPDDNPAFWSNMTFDDSIFESMTKFELTGTADAPSTIHRSSVNLPHGFHRYFVKCRAFNDGKIRGNKADEIRFAVDKEAPVTSHSTDATAYNGWFNRDVTVSLTCGDPSIMGIGLDWHFRCNKTYYCTGQGCADLEGKFKEYRSSIKFNSTGYISYYSTDNGMNIERVVKDVVFQIDKTPPNFTVEFYDGTRLADVLVMNTVYKVRVVSSKPFISAAISGPRVAYTSQPSKFSGTIALMPTDDQSVWEGVFFMENINANRGFEGTGLFTATGIDYHNVSGAGTTSIPIDTKPPEAPVIEPSLESKSRDASDYQLMGYDVHYYNGTYYTKRPSLFITGYTSEYLDMIAVTSVDDVESERIFTQTPTALVYNDTLLSGFAGEHEIKVSGDITRRVNSSLYMGFDQVDTTIGPKTRYGEYGMFYDVTNLIYHGGDEQYTSVTVYPGLEESSKLDRKIMFYDKENPSYWFGFDVPLAEFRNTSFYLKSYDAAGNIVRYPAISIIPPYLVFFSDPVAPQVMSHFPRDGTTSRTTMDIGVIVKEGRQQSGIWRESVNMTVDGRAVSYTIEHVAELEDSDSQNNYFRIYYHASALADGDYDVSLDAKDLAGNELDESQSSSHWAFTVDRNAPEPPAFSLVGGWPDQTGERWYARESPDFMLDFSANRNSVTVVDVMMEDAATEGGAANCTNTSRNVFLCRFATPKAPGGIFWADYGVIVKAFKTLDDGTNSNIRSYGPFAFTVDDQPPSFIPALQTRFMDNFNLTIGAVVTNENHPLFADIELFGVHYAPYYSSNNGSSYYFMWDIPDYGKEKEGPTTLVLTLSDFAQNRRSVSIPVYLDLTAPRLDNISIDISNTVDIGTELFTAQPNVTVSGRFIDDDIDRVWVVPGDFNMTSGSLEGKKYADIRYAGSVPESFSVSVRLFDPGAGTKMRTPIKYNFMLINQINNMNLYVRDKAGHVSTRKLKVISDIVAPSSPMFCLGENWIDCMPTAP
jgi:hypothetical protein